MSVPSYNQLEREMYYGDFNYYLKQLMDERVDYPAIKGVKISGTYNFKIDEFNIKELSQSRNQEIKEAVQHFIYDVISALNFVDPNDYGIRLKDFIDYVHEEIDLEKGYELAREAEADQQKQNSNNFENRFVPEIAHQSGLNYNADKTDYCEIGADLKLKELRLAGLGDTEIERIKNLINGSLLDLVQEMKLTKVTVSLHDFLEYVIEKDKD
jgi:hypothetical protein